EGVVLFVVIRRQVRAIDGVGRGSRIFGDRTAGSVVVLDQGMNEIHEAGQQVAIRAFRARYVVLVAEGGHIFLSPKAQGQVRVRIPVCTEVGASGHEA